MPVNAYLSTVKFSLHPRGNTGLCELTSTKFKTKACQGLPE